MKYVGIIGKAIKTSAALSTVSVCVKILSDTTAFLRSLIKGSPGLGTDDQSTPLSKTVSNWFQSIWKQYPNCS